MAHFVTFCVLLFALAADAAFGADNSMTDVTTPGEGSEPAGSVSSTRSDYRNLWGRILRDPQLDLRTAGCAANATQSASFVRTSLRCNEDTDINRSMADPIAGAESASAAAGPEQAPRANDLVLIGGYGDLRQRKRVPTGAVDVRFAKDYFGLHPYVDLAVGNRGSRYAGLGLLYDFEMPCRLRLTVGSGPGYYRHNRGSTYLGYAVEFHSWLEVSRVVLGRRIGLSVGHISNAHLASCNPGSENVSLSVVVRSW
jgi:hypothetical protein